MEKLKNTRIQNFLLIVFVAAIFTGCKSGENELTFVHLADIHVAPGAESEADLRDVVSDINNLEPDFVVVTGDLTNNGTIVGINAMDGSEVWNVDAGTPVLAEGIIDEGALYIGGGQSAFFKIDMSDGEVEWQFDGINGLIQGRPAEGNDEVIFGVWDRHLYSLDKMSGKMNWKWNNGSTAPLLSPGNIAPAIANDKVFIVAPDRFMTALDLETGNQVWRTSKHQVRESMGISPDGRRVYAKLMNDSIIAMSTQSGKPETLWTIDAGIEYDHNPCPVEANGEMVVAATKNGLVVAVSPDGDKVLWQYKAGNSSINKLIIEDSGSIWMTLMEGRILQIKPQL